MLVVNSRFLTQNITGVQRFAIEISLKLKEMLNDNVMFVTPHNIIQKDIADVLNAKIIGKHKGHLWEQFDLMRWLKQNGNPLLLNLCNLAPVFYNNKISTIHDVAFVKYPQSFTRKFLLLYRILIPKIILSSKLIFTVSQFSKNEIIDAYGIEDNKIEIIYNAVSKQFKPYNNE